MILKIVQVFFLMLVVFLGTAQESSSYAEKLGWEKTDRVVILHVDDVGMSYDSNEGAIQAMTKGVANSCSVMMPCPWVPGFVQYLKAHPGMDAGLHLTLNAEWKQYRWGPLAGKPAVPGLVDAEGALWRSVSEVVQHATAEEVDREIRAQVDRALVMGFQPTHLDSHMGTLFATPAFLSKYIQLGMEKKIPVMLPAGHATLINEQMKFDQAGLQQIRGLGSRLWEAGLPVLDDLYNFSYGWKLPAGQTPTDKNLQEFTTQQYIAGLKSLKPGVTMVIMHCTSTTEVFPQISDSGPTRKGDLLAMMDPALKAFIDKEGIILTTWRELAERRRAAK